MAKIEMTVYQQQDVAELTPRNYTQIGGVYGDELRPQFLSSVDNVQISLDESDTNSCEPRFFRMK
jgi:hypothetical protein